MVSCAWKAEQRKGGHSSVITVLFGCQMNLLRNISAAFSRRIHVFVKGAWKEDNVLFVRKRNSKQLLYNESGREQEKQKNEVHVMNGCNQLLPRDTKCYKWLQGRKSRDKLPSARCNSCYDKDEQTTKDMQRATTSMAMKTQTQKPVDLSTQKIQVNISCPQCRRQKL